MSKHKHWRPHMSPKRDLFQLREAAGVLGLSEEQVLYMGQRGWLKIITAGQAVLVASKEVREYLKAGIREGKVHIELPPTPLPEIAQGAE